MKTSLGADESEEGDFFYNEEEVLNGVGGENRAALLERYDAMLEDSEQPELEEACYHLAYTATKSAFHKYRCADAADCAKNGS